MDCLMAGWTKCHQVFCSVIAQRTSSLDMMDLQLIEPSASLATPAIALEYVPT